MGKYQKYLKFKRRKYFQIKLSNIDLFCRHQSGSDWYVYYLTKRRP